MTDIFARKQKKLSNAYSTGGGGQNYEHHTDALFLLALLVDGFVPALNKPITKLCFQARHLGYHTDDLVAITENGTKLLCQIKSSITATRSDKEFQEVITAAWNDYSGQQTDQKHDKIALITSSIAKKSMDSLMSIHEQALAAENAEDFLRRIKQSNFVSNGAREKLAVLEHCLKQAKGSELSESELHGFCRAFILIVFDGNDEGSIHEALSKSLIHCKSSADPRMVWDALVEYAGQCDQIAAIVTRESVDLHIQELLGFQLSEVEIASFSPSENWLWAVLIGAWDENNETDVQAIEKISGKSFSDFQAFTRERLLAGDQYISLMNGIWRVSFRKELFPHLKDLLFDDAICGAFRVAAHMIAESGKRFERDDVYGIIKPEDGWFSNSDSIRKGLMEGLCLMANGEPPKNSSAGLVAQQAGALIRGLFRNCSWKTLAGLGDLLPMLAEVAPAMYLQELEAFSVQQKRELIQLFPKKERQSFLEENYITEILWSLETLAWVPEYLIPSISCLGTLETVGYEKTNYANTPLNSIATILNAAKPQTYATAEQRKSAIRALMNDSRELCWSVIRTLLPESSSMLVETPKPKYITLPQVEYDAAQNEMLQFFLETAIKLSSDSPERTAELADRIHYMSVEMISDYLNQIITASQKWSDEMRYPVWDSLRELKVQAILENNQKKPDTALYRLLENAISASEPVSKWYRYLHLYTDKIDEYYLEDTVQNWKERDEAKSKAILDLYLTDGIEKVISFAERVNNDQDVGWRLGYGLNHSQINEMLSMYAKNQDSRFLSAVMGGFIQANGVHVLSEIGLEKYDAAFRVRVLFNAPFTPETFSVIETYLPDKKIYWKGVPFNWFSPNWSIDTMESVILELEATGRYTDIINALGHLIKRTDLSDELLERIMFGAASEQALNRINSNTVCRIIERLQQAEQPNIDALAELEYVFLPFLGEPSSVRPKALYYKLSNECPFFCKMIELTYKPRHAEHQKQRLSEGVMQRLFILTHQYRVVPGVDWNGEFHDESFQAWISEVLDWAQKADRIEVTQQIIGNGLSYAKTEDGLPNRTILEELNKAQNVEMRRGYLIGIRNQRGVHWVDPEGKPERALAQKYKKYAKAAVESGFSRFADTLNAIADSFLDDAERIQREQLTGDE